MKRGLALTGLCVLGSVLSACGSQAPPAAPSVAPAATTSSKLALTSLRVDGPATLPPGESAQYTATATYTDGSSRDVTGEVRWSSTNDAIVTVTGTGMSTARANGEASVTATLAPLNHSREIVVVPAGRYKLRLIVNEDHVTVPINGVRVEVLSEAAAGLEGVTDWNGSVSLYGVPQDVQVRLSKSGYESSIQSFHVPGNWALNIVSLPSSVTRPILPGAYQLTVSAGGCAGGDGLPDALKTRRYSATIWNAGVNAIVELSGAAFATAWCPLCHETRGNRFQGQSQPDGARFTLSEYEAPFDWNAGIYPNVVEQLADGRLLSIAGHVIVAATSDGFAGTLDGSFAIYNAFDLTYDGSLPVASCRSSSHTFTLVRETNR
jgi:hypothetical protein